jgi:hypothetical protein
MASHPRLSSGGCNAQRDLRDGKIVIPLSWPFLTATKHAGHKMHMNIILPFHTLNNPSN